MADTAHEHEHKKEPGKDANHAVGDGHAHNPFDPGHLIGHVKDADYFEYPTGLTAKEKFSIPQFRDVTTPIVKVDSGNPLVEQMLEPFDGRVTKFMIFETVVALIAAVVFTQFASVISGGAIPRGWFWNLIESILLFLRDEVARPAIGDHAPDDHGKGDHHDDHGHAKHGHDAHGHDSRKHDDHGHGHGHGHAKRHPHAADKFLPYLWTVFFFILGCNLMGLFPWAGSPTGALAVTSTLALITFFTVVGAGMMERGPIGFWIGQVPTMDLPLPLAVVLKPGIFVIEVLGLCIKHFVLAVRLLANVMAGHLVLVVILTFITASGIAAQKMIADGSGGMGNAIYFGVTISSILGALALSMLELFVAFLQAYIFTFLSALFIGMALHEH